VLGNPQVSDASDNEFHRERNAADREPPGAAGKDPARDIAELVSAVYEEAPGALRTRLLECLVRPLGPLALVGIAGGAFGHLLYQLKRDAVPISLDHARRVTSEQVLELTRFVEQCSPDALLRIGALMADHRIGVATRTGTALLTALRLDHSETLRGPIM
jgi:hypothetical protein